MITKPELPPRAGYVEVEIAGKRHYKNVATGMLLEDEPAPGPTAGELLSVLLGEVSEDE